MATVVAVMDGPSFAHNTDVIVVADPARRNLRWVPRDLWCEDLGDRINRAYVLGGHDGLLEALAEHGIHAAHSLIVRPDGIRSALGDLTVRMPVAERMEFDYEGDVVAFTPPIEELSGERIHAWIGARTRIGDSPRVRLPDLDRIRRQQELVAVLIGEGFEFSRFVALGQPVRSSGDGAMTDLRQARWNWSFDVLDDVEPRERDGKAVLVREQPED